MHLNFANIKFREFPKLAKLNGRKNLCSRKLMSAKINVIKVNHIQVSRKYCLYFEQLQFEPQELPIILTFFNWKPKKTKLLP